MPLRLCLTLSALLGLAACAGSAPLSTGPQPSADRAYVERQLSELAELPRPAGCAEADWAQLTAALGAMLRRRLEDPAAVARETAALAGGGGLTAVMDTAGGGATIQWFYVHRGDYNQDGIVSVSDLTPLGANFAETGPFDFRSIESVVDGDGNGEINIADLTPIGAALGRAVGGYDFFASASAADVPGDGEVPALEPLASVEMSAAEGNPGRDRKFFTLPIADPGLTYDWVHPFDALDDSLGPRSTVLGAALTLSFSVPPADGDGSALSPFRLDEDTRHALRVEHEFDGDVTDDPLLRLSATATGGSVSFEGAELVIGAGAVDPFELRADRRDFESDLEPAVAAPVHARVGPPNDPPVAVLTATPDSGTRLVAADLDASASSDPDGDALSFAFDLDGDGVFETDNGGQATLARVFSTPGTLSVGVQVTDPDGLSATATTDITVNGAWHIVTVDGGVAGSNPILTLADGHPAIAYADFAGGAVLFRRALDPQGISWGAAVTVFDASTPSPQLELITIGGIPAIAFGDAVGSLHWVTAQNAQGSAWNTPMLTGHAGFAPSAADMSGIPGMAYLAIGSNNLMFVRANSFDGSSWPLAALTVDAVLVGSAPTLQVVGSVPGIGYKDHAAGALKYAVATDDVGTSWFAPVTLDPVVGTASSLDVFAAGGVPVGVSAGGFNLRFHQASETTGNADWQAPLTLDGGFVNCLVSGATLGGVPAVVYTSGADLALRIAGDAAGGSWSAAAAERIDDGFTNSAPDFAEVNGLAAVAYDGSSSTGLRYAVFF